MPLHAQLRVQVQFDGASWVELSELCRGARWRRGRSNEFESVNAGRAQVRLSNANRWFDPEYVDGPFYGQLKPRTRIRIGFVWPDGNTYSRQGRVRSYLPYVYWQFYGYVDGWPQSYNGPHDAEVRLTATDAFGVWARQHLPSVWQQTIEALSVAPVVWWRLGEQSGTTAADSSGNKHHATYHGGAVFNSRAGLIDGDTDNAIEFDGGTQFVETAASASSLGGPDAWLAVIKLDAVATAGLKRVYDFGNLYGNVTLAVYGSDAGADAGKLYARGNGLGPLKSTSRVDDNAPHVVVLTTTGTGELFVDGVDEATSTSSAGLWSLNAPQGWIGAYAGASEFFPGAIDEVAIFSEVLTAADAVALTAAASAPWEGDTPKQRIDRLLDYTGWPGSDRAIDVGSAVLVPFA